MFNYLRKAAIGTIKEFKAPKFPKLKVAKKKKLKQTGSFKTPRIGSKLK
jgi:hypothetical protein